MATPTPPTAQKAAAAHRPRLLDFITGNPGKLAEVRAILAAGGDEGGRMPELRSRAVEVLEIQGSVEEVAREKARSAAVKVRLFSFCVFLFSGFWSVLSCACWGGGVRLGFFGNGRETGEGERGEDYARWRPCLWFSWCWSGEQGRNDGIS